MSVTRPRTSLLGRMPDTDIYEDVKLYPTVWWEYFRVSDDSAVVDSVFI